MKIESEQPVICGRSRIPDDNENDWSFFSPVVAFYSTRNSEQKVLRLWIVKYVKRDFTLKLNLINHF